MPELITFPDGGFAFLKGGFPYSQGVRALGGFGIERVRFARPVPVAAGFATIEAHLKAIGRPRTAFCACELRSPEPFSPEGFRSFNEGYVGVLKDWGLFRDGVNPVARSNVAPEIDPPAEPCFYAFCYSVPAAGAAPTFVVSGSGEWPEGGKFPQDIVAHGDVAEAGMRAKARFVMDRMDDRLKGLRASWNEASAVQIYTVHDIHPLIEDTILPRAGNGAGLTWHYCRPPIRELEYEMDLRRVQSEKLLNHRDTE